MERLKKRWRSRRGQANGTDQFGLGLEAHDPHRLGRQSRFVQHIGRIPPPGGEEFRNREVGGALSTVSVPNIAVAVTGASKPGPE